VTYSFVDAGLQQRLDPDHEALALANPLSSEMGVMRTSLWPGLVQALQNNLHRQQNRLCLFECGLKFVSQASELSQELSLAGLLSGDVAPPQWGQAPRAIDFFDAKGHLESLFARTGRPAVFRFEAAKHPALHPGQSARILRADQPVGWLGALHPGIARELEISQSVILYEINLTAVAEGSIPEYTPVSRFPAIRRDLSLVMAQGVSAQQVQDTVRAAGPEWLQGVELFDVYTGEGIDSGRKSLSVGLTLQDLSRTLTDNEVDDAIERIVGRLEADLGATLR
jgi:phenylalanyl-tRNA synthetase beta chain